MHNYIKNEEYQTLIAPLVDQIMQLCEDHSISYAMIFAVENDSEHTKYESHFKRYRLPLKDDQISRHMLVNQGFIPINKAEIPEIQFK